MKKTILHGFLQGGQTVTKSLDKSAIIHFCKGSPALAKRAIEKGHDVINSTHNYTYLDYGYGSIFLARAYSFDPIFRGLEKKYHHKVKGFRYILAKTLFYSQRKCKVFLSVIF